MKLMKKSFSMLLAVAMVFTATFGCMTVSSFAADSGTGSETAEMTGFSFENVEGPESGEAGQTISLNIQFDKNIKILDSDALMSELVIKIMGTDVSKTARDITMSASGKVLNIKMVSNDWAAIYAGSLSLETNGLNNIVSSDNNTPVKLYNFSTNIPIGIKLDNKSTAGTADAAASDTVQVTHRANMRGMYHFQLMSNGISVLGNSGTFGAGTMTSHAHNFNSSITVESIASAMATAINNIEGYTAVYEEGSDTFTVTADEAKDGEELTVQMFEADADCRDQKALLEKAKTTLDGVDKNTNPAIDKAYEAYEAFMEKDDSSKMQMNYIKLINQMNEAPVAPPEIAEGTKVTLDGGDNVSISLESVPDGWISAVNGITVQQVGVENDPVTISPEKYNITKDEQGSSYLNLKSDIFRNENTTSGKKSGQFMITLSAAGFNDCTTVVNVKNYGAEKFYIRYIDEKTGKVIKSKAYTMEQLKSFSKAQSGAMYQTYCSMAGLRNFCADGVLLEDLMADAEITGKAGMTVKLRTNDRAADESGNDSETDNAYYGMGTFDYEKLFSDRYYFPAVFTDEVLKVQLSDANAKFVDKGDRTSEATRTALGSSEGKVAVRPMIAWNYDEKVFKNDTSKPSSENYTDQIKNERAFRFLYGIAMESDNVTANETTTWSAAHCVFGIDIVDPDYKEPSSSKPSNSSSSTVTPVTKYTVNKPADSAEGKVSVSPSSAEKGDTVTVTVTPADGYKTGNVTVTDKSGSKVSVSGSDNKYTFKMPASNVTVKVTYEKTAAAEQPVQSIALPFKDVKTDRWSYSAIKYAYENKLFSGTSANEFSPADEMTRGMLVTVLYRLAGEPAVNGDAGFTDVKSGDWYAKAVAWAKANNIVSGVSAAEFAPNKDITREQMAAILYRYAAYKSYSTAANGSIAGFNDNANVSAFAKDAVSWAVGEKLISGTGNNTLAPKGNATREQVAAILQRFVENIAK